MQTKHFLQLMMSYYEYMIMLLVKKENNDGIRY